MCCASRDEGCHVEEVILVQGVFTSANSKLVMTGVQSKAQSWHNKKE